MKLYLIAGEASGDLHGSLLIHELKKMDPATEIRCWGGDKMQAEGGVLVRHYRDLAFMGFAEVVMNLRTILRNLSFCKKDIAAYKPDAIVLIDYPGFNLRIAKWARQHKIPVIYYISPQVWAWKENRVKMMKQSIDKMIVILPFEKKFFEDKWGWKVDYVGHPLVEVIEQWKADNPPTPVEQIHEIALLPGSRKQEILKKLPVMLELTRSFPEYRFVIAKAPAIENSFYEKILKPYANVSSVADQTYPLLARAKAAIVTSGTATLETALFGVPEVVCYKTSNITYQIGKRLVRVKYISLVNLIMDRPVVKELIQDEMNTVNLRNELDLLLHNEDRKNLLQENYAELRKVLSSEGRAPQKAAEIIRNFVRSVV